MAHLASVPINGDGVTLVHNRVEVRQRDTTVCPSLTRIHLACACRGKRGQEAWGSNLSILEKVRKLHPARSLISNIERFDPFLYSRQRCGVSEVCRSIHWCLKRAAVCRHLRGGQLRVPRLGDSIVHPCKCQAAGALGVKRPSDGGEEQRVAASLLCLQPLQKGGVPSVRSAVPSD